MVIIKIKETPVIGQILPKDKIRGLFSRHVGETIHVNVTTAFDGDYRVECELLKDLSLKIISYTKV